QTRGRVLQPVPDRLRLGALDLLVAGAGAAELLNGGERAPFVVGEQRVVPVHAGDDEIEVETADAIGLELGQVRRDHRAPVAALRAVALVAELAHDARECRRHAPGRPTGLAGR